MVDSDKAAKIAKLLTRAGHPSTPDVEAVSAVRLAYRLLDTAGSNFENAFQNSGEYTYYDSYYSKEEKLKEAQENVKLLKKQVNTLQKEVNRLKKELEKNTSAPEPDYSRYYSNEPKNEKAGRRNGWTRHKWTREEVQRVRELTLEYNMTAEEVAKTLTREFGWTVTAPMVNNVKARTRPQSGKTYFGREFGEPIIQRVRKKQAA